jgi:hypothetical protein
MARSLRKASASVARVLLQCLKEGIGVEIDGLGTFSRGDGAAIKFVPSGRPRVFLAYVEEDCAVVSRIYDTLDSAGFEPWMDCRKLMPGQNWPRAIERAISVSDYFIACFSTYAVTKRGHFHAELRYALDCAGRFPLDEVFFIPLRLDECEVPARISRTLQYVDLFPSFDKGMRRVIHSMRRRVPTAKVS